MTLDLPMPMECHPAYADKPWVMDWLNGDGRYADRHVIQMPVSKPIQAATIEERPDSFAFNVRTLTKQKAWAVAPYTGKPFVYMWYFATDELGRSIAGKSWIQYLPWNPTMECDPYDTPSTPLTLT